jgi:anthranilate phosphoribosyltransferase
VVIRDAIIAVTGGKNLEQQEAAAVMEEIMTGTATPAQIAAFLTALRLKGETYTEIAGMAEVMQMKATHVPYEGIAIDTCGTGGDGLKTFNISTTTAFVVAGAGLTVAKHGNRAMSSSAGSADVLEALGAKIDLDVADVVRCMQEAGIGFMYAPNFHPAMRFAGPVRREIGIRTVFNLLGPLTNPARVRHQVIGVPSTLIAQKIAYALSCLDITHALVVHGDGGMDELSLSGPALYYEVRPNQEPERHIVDPDELGLERAPREAMAGGTAEENATITRAILEGKEQGPKRDIVLLNAAAALLAGDLVDDIATGMELARKSLDDGHAFARLETLINVSNATAAAGG